MGAEKKEELEFAHCHQHKPLGIWATTRWCRQCRNKYRLALKEAEAAEP